MPIDPRGVVRAPLPLAGVFQVVASLARAVQGLVVPLASGGYADVIIPIPSRVFLPAPSSVGRVQDTAVFHAISSHIPSSCLVGIWGFSAGSGLGGGAKPSPAILLRDFGS